MARLPQLDSYALGALLGLTAVATHTYTHTFFVSWTDLFSIGALQANLPIFLTVTLGVGLMGAAVRRYSGWKLAVVTLGLWLLPAFGHDGTHALYVPLDEVLRFGLHGIPESGLTIAVLHTFGLLYVYASQR